MVEEQTNHRLYGVYNSAHVLLTEPKIKRPQLNNDSSMMSVKKDQMRNSMVFSDNKNKIQSTVLDPSKHVETQKKTPQTEDVKQKNVDMPVPTSNEDKSKAVDGNILAEKTKVEQPPTEKKEAEKMKVEQPPAEKKDGEKKKEGNSKPAEVKPKATEVPKAQEQPLNPLDQVAKQTPESNIEKKDDSKPKTTEQSEHKLIPENTPHLEYHQASMEDQEDGRGMAESRILASSLLKSSPNYRPTLSTHLDTNSRVEGDAKHEWRGSQC